MNSDRNKQENKKALKVLVPLVIVCGLIGGCIGAYASTNSAADLADTIGTALYNLMYTLCPYGVIVVAVVGLTVEWGLYHSAKKQYEMYSDTMDESQEDAFYEEIDSKLSKGLLAGSAGMVLEFMFFAGVMGCLNRYLESNRELIYIFAIVFFIISSFGTAKLQQLIVDFEKVLNPQKKGSVYDIKFNDKWEDSCDEMEKLLIYKSAYASYKATNMAFCVAVVVLMLLSFFFDYGPLPAMTVCVLWLVSLISYCVAAMKLEREKLN